MALTPADPSLRALGYETPRPDVQRYVPTSARSILELGCSNGALGAAIKQRQNATILGVEIDPYYATDAEKVLDRVVVSGAEEFAAGERPPEAPFDCLICADVLEHLVDPWSTLRCASEWLSPGATVVVSLPNVECWKVLGRVIRTGSWPREDFGAFDRTHLRWFTIKDAHAMLRDAGLEPVATDPRYWLRDKRLGPQRDAVARALAHTPVRRFLPQQYVIAAVKR